MRKCTYIWFTMMRPGGDGPVTREAPGKSEWMILPLTKKLPSSSSVIGPPRVAAPTAAAARLAKQQRMQFTTLMRVRFVISPPADLDAVSKNRTGQQINTDEHR